MLNHPQWIKVPWVVFLVAFALKIWQFGRSLKRHLIGTTPSTDRFRHSLERICAEAQMKAKWRT